jgi:hypothetical protein
MPRESESVNDGKNGINGRCLNPLCGKPVETKPGAVWAKTSCSDDCRNMLSAFRRVACALFSELEPAEAIDKLLRLVQQENAKGSLSNRWPS